MDNAQVREKMFRLFWLLAGLLFTGLAFIGIVLPLVPTTPFLLLAAFCFARSSQKLSAWLYRHRLFGPLLTNWEEHGAIGRRTKILSVVMLVATPVASYLLGSKLWVLAIQIPIVMGSGWFILTRPNGPTVKSEPKE